VIDVERLVRETCSPHEDVVPTSKDPNPRKCSVGHDTSTVSNVSPKLLRFIIPAGQTSATRPKNWRIGLTRCFEISDGNETLKDMS
jgi:hypothetical protein